MIGKLLGREGVDAALVLALSGTLAVLAAKGDGPLSPGRVLSGILSNPIPVRRATGARGGESAPTPRRQAAA